MNVKKKNFLRGQIYLKKCVSICLIAAILLSIQSCSGSRSPLEKLTSRLKNSPDYSIILEDMNVSGSLFPQYYHKYKIIEGEKTYYTGWQKVAKPFYRQNENYLGMSLISKTEDGYVKTPSPPGYQYVGNSRYGEWKSDSSGNSMWVFFGQYMFMSSMFNLFSRPVYRSNYNTYSQYRNNGKPYFGSSNQYGTNGTATKQTNKSFFQRKMAKQKAKQSSFKNKINQRIKRSQNTFHSRGGGFGK